MRSAGLLLSVLLLSACATVAPPPAERCLGAEPVPVIELAPAGTLRLAILGDAGEEGSPGWPAVVEGVRQAAPDAILLLGDNFYECGIDRADSPRWAHYAPLLALGRPVFPVLGNHDYGCLTEDADPDAQIAASGRPGLEGWRFPARNYRIRFGALLQIAMIDTMDVAKGREGAWRPACALRELAPGQARWTLAAGHHTIVAGSVRSVLAGGAIRNMRSLTPLLREGGVDLFAAGHDHHLELVPGDPDWLVSGAASRLRTTLPLHRSSFRRSDYGFALLEATEATLRVRFVSAPGGACCESSPWFDVEQ